MESVQFISTTPNQLANLIDEKIKVQLEDLKKSFTPKQPDEFLTRNETSEILKISLVTLHDWVKKGILKPYKMGNKTYFSRKEITQTMFSSNNSEL